MDLIFAAAAATADGGSSGRSVRRGAADGLHGAGDDVQIWCVLLLGADLVAFGRRDKDLQGRGEAAKEKACGACGFCAQGEWRFGEDCKRTKRAERIVGMRAKSVAPTDLGDDVCACAGAGGKVAGAAAAKADSGNGRAAEWRTAGKGVRRGEGVADTRPYVFGRRKV